MVAVGIITLFLTLFTFACYSYIHRHTDEHDVSFFLSVLIISLVMNLCTNAGGTYVLSWVYLGIDVLFLALAFAVDAGLALDFYKSIVPWCANTFTAAKTIGWQILSFFVFPAGLAFYFVWYKGEKEALALECGKMALWGVFFWIILLWTILGIAL